MNISTLRDRYQHKLRFDNQLKEVVTVLAFSFNSRLLAGADSEGNLVVFDCNWGTLAHHVRMPPGIHVTTAKWGTRYELFCGCNNGDIICLAFKVSQGTDKVRRAALSDVVRD